MDIYEQHDKAFQNVSAFVILDATGERVASVAIKYPRDGAGRLYAYTHFMGLPVTRGWASGYGYDKRSPSVVSGFKSALAALDKAIKEERPEVKGRGEQLADYREGLAAIVAAITANDGEYWDRLLQIAGFRVIQAV